MTTYFSLFRSSFYLVFLLLAFLASCLPDIQDVKVDRTHLKIAAPLINSKTTVDNLFDKVGRSDNIVIYPDNTLGFVYKGNVVEVTGKELFRSFGRLFFKLVDKKSTINIPIPDQEVKEGHIGGDTLIFLFQGNGKDTIDYTLTIPTMKSPDGQPLSIKTHFDGEPIRIKRSVKDFSFGFNPGNSFDVLIDAKDKDGQDLPDIGAVWMAYDTLYFTYIEGVFGKDSFLLPKDTVIIDVFDKLEEGGAFFKDPQVTVTIESSFGFPVSARIKELSVINKKQLRVPLHSPLIDKGIFLEYPSLAEVGASKSTVFAFDKDNSNIYTAFNSNPTKLIYEFTGIGNPDPSNPTLGFVTDSSFLRINVKVELPINGWVDRFALSEKVDWNWDPGNLSSVDSVTIKTILNNGLPIDMEVQVYLLKDDEVLDSIFVPKRWQVKGAPIDAVGFSTGLTENRNSTKVGKSVIDHMQMANKALYKLKVSTTNAPDKTSSVRKTDVIDLKLGVLVQI